LAIEPQFWILRFLSLGFVWDLVLEIWSFTTHAPSHTTTASGADAVRRAGLCGCGQCDPYDEKISRRAVAGANGRAERGISIAVCAGSRRALEQGGPSCGLAADFRGLHRGWRRENERTCFEVAFP
jgi:hypothetical protein